MGIFAIVLEKINKSEKSQEILEWFRQQDKTSLDFSEAINQDFNILYEIGKRIKSGQEPQNNGLMEIMFEIVALDTSLLHKSLEIFHLLVKCNDVKILKAFFAKIDICENGEVKRIFYELLNAKESASGRTPLRCAIMNEEPKIVRQWVEYNTTDGTITFRGEQNNKWDMIELLIAKGAVISNDEAELLLTTDDTYRGPWRGAWGFCINLFVKNSVAEAIKNTSYNTEKRKILVKKLKETLYSFNKNIIRKICEISVKESTMEEKQKAIDLMSNKFSEILKKEGFVYVANNFSSKGIINFIKKCLSIFVGWLLHNRYEFENHSSINLDSKQWNLKEEKLHEEINKNIGKDMGLIV